MKLYNDVDFQVYNEDQVKFYEEGHIYTNQGTNKNYTSVTTYLKKFNPDTNWNYWSFYKGIEELCMDRYGHTAPLDALKALVKEGVRKGLKEYDAQDYAMNIFLNKNKKFTKLEMINYHNKKKQDWEKSKKEGLDRGSAWHKKEEEKALFIDKVYYEGKFISLSTSYRMARTKKFKLSRNTKDGAYVEMLMSHPLIEIAGQADQIFIETVGRTRYLDIGDWKTNKKIDMYSRWNNKMKAPLEHLDYCDYSSYALQLSLYAWIAECHGFVPRHLALAHVRNKIERIPVEYLRDEIFKIAYLRLSELAA